MNFTDTFTTLPTMPRKQVLKSFIGSLNSSIIGNLRGHIRASRFENISRSGTTPDIDTYNDALAEAGVAVASRQAFADAGIAQVMPPLEIARHMETLRTFCIELLASMATHPSDTSLTLDDTLDFQINRTPDINEPALKALSIAINTPLEVLKAAKVEVLNNERKELIDMRGQITSLASSWTIDEGEDAAEAAFTALPAHVQYKLWASLAVALKRAGDKALANLLRYNRLDSAGDITMIKAVYNELAADLAKFADQHRTELSEYIERGGQLAEVPLMV